MPDQKTNPNLKLTLTVRNPLILIRQENNKRYLTIPVVCGCGIGAIHLVRKISAIFNRPSPLCMYDHPSPSPLYAHVLYVFRSFRRPRPPPPSARTY